jgi:hypothetical protein
VETKYPGHRLVIRDKVYDIGNNITIEEDLDTIYISGSLDLPNITTNEWSTQGLRKYDTLNIYFKYFDNEVDRQQSNINDMQVIFTGYIDTLPTSEDKSSGLNYNGLGFKSSIALAWERSAIIPFASRKVIDIITQALEYTKLNLLIDSIEYDSNIPDYFTPKVDSTYYFGNVLEQLKDNYAIQTYQKGNGTLVIKQPSSFYSGERTVFEYDLTTNIFNIDYGDITQKVDCVCVFGLNDAGIAFDPIAYQLRLGQTPTGETISPNPEDLNPLYIIRRDLLGQEACQLLAREKLIELAKNYAISFDCVYEPNQNVGDMFVIKNSSVIDSNQKWIIKKRTVSISKDNIRCNITAYSNSIVDLPEDLLLSSTGVLDTDILEIKDRDVINTVL